MLPERIFSYLQILDGICMSKKKKTSSGSSKSTPKAKRPQSQVKKSVPSSVMFTPGFWKENKWAALVLFSLAFLLYGYSITFGEYVLDDKIVISENKFVQEGAKGIKDILANDTFTGFLGEQQDLVVGSRYRPLSLVFFAMEVEMFGLNAKVGHFFNVLWYALTGLLLFRVFALFVPGTPGRKWYFQLPFIAALIFVLHPIHSEAVANIKGRDEIIALFLSLATLYYSLKYFEESKPYLLAIASGIFFLAILAKENSLTFMAVIPLTLYLFVNTDIKKIALTIAPLLATVMIYLFMRQEIIGYLLDSGKEVTSLMNNPFVDATSKQKYATIFFTLIEYVRLLFFPLNLTHDYYPYQVPILNWTDPRAFLSLIFYVAIGGMAVIWHKKYKVFSWSVLVFILTLSIVSNIPFTVGTFMNERFMFMPSIGFCLLIGYWLVERLPALLKSNEKMAKMVPAALVALIAIGFSAKTIARVPAWQNNLELNRAAVKVSVNSARANSFMGYSLYRKALEEKGNKETELPLYEEALPYVNRALEIYPQYKDALTAKGGLIAGIYKYDRDLDKLLQGFYEILEKNHISYSDQYMEYLNKKGQNADKLAAHYHRTGYELFFKQQNKLGLAIKYLEYGRQVAPTNVQILKDIVEVYYKAKKYDKVKEVCQLVLSQNPGAAPFSEYYKLVNVN